MAEHPMTERPDDARAEQAFRDAFGREADRLPAAPRPVVRRRRRPVLAAAAAVLLLVGGIGLVATLPDDPAPDDPAPGESAADPDGPAGSVEASGAGDLPPATDGWQWVSWRDVAVEVPDSWVEGEEPGEDWCADTGRPVKPAAPYVARTGGVRGVLAIACGDEQPPASFGPAPLRLMVPHLTFAVPGDVSDGETTLEGWTATVRTVGDVQLRLYTDAATADVVEHALGSIRSFETDQHGCDTTSPVQAEQHVRPTPFDVAGVEDVDAISICQYDRHLGPDAVALAASRRIEGAEARALLEGIRSAPTAGGPDRPGSCAATMHGDQALAVRLHHDGTTDDLFVYYDWCTDNGYDDGTTRRELTSANCRPLFAAPVVAWSYSSSLAGRCGHQ